MTESAPSEENRQLAFDHFDRVWHQGEFDTDVLTDDYWRYPNPGFHELQRRRTHQ